MKDAPALQWPRAIALLAVLALIGLGLVWESWLARTGSGTLALKVLPLAFALSGLARNRLYTFRWLSLLLWLYVTEGLVRASTEVGVVRPMAIAEVLLALALFGACAARVRLAPGLQGSAHPKVPQ